MIRELSMIGARASAGAAVISQQAGVHWYEAEDGSKRCLRCHKKLTHMVKWPGYTEPQEVNCICNCGKSYNERIREEIRAEAESGERARARAEAFGSPEISRKMAEQTFARDRDPEGENSRLARIYCERFPNVKKWLYYYGRPGTGKTFTAACIANDLLRRGFTVRMATPQQLEGETWDDREERFAKYLGTDLFILDDFGTERRSDYSYELTFRLIDDRSKAGKPMVITSNITALELANVTGIKAQRIAERIARNATWFEFKRREDKSV